MKRRQLNASLACIALLSASHLAIAGDAPAPAATTPAIAGVVNAGTKIQLVQDGFEAVEGPMRDADGSVLFTNNQAGRVLRTATNDKISTWFEGPFGANALGRLPKGEIVATLNKSLAIGVLQPGAEPKVLADKYDGKPFNRPNDLVVDRRGNIYFTDSIPPGAANPAALPSSVYQIAPDGKLILVTTSIQRPNGVALSPDEKTLYVANTAGEWVIAYDLNSKGEVGTRREFAKLAMPPPAAPSATAPATAPAAPSSGADGIAVDEKGRIYVATAVGVQVFSDKGEALGVIAMPKQPQNLAFAGKDRSVLYVVGRGAVYKIATLTRGRDAAGK
jgi:gluconolactonase